MRVAVLGGTGDLGFGLAARLAKAGVAVIIGSRKHERAVEAAGKIKTLLGKENVSGEVNRDAVKDADVVFFSVPYEGLVEIARDVAPFIQPSAVNVSCVVPFADDVCAAEVLAENLQQGAKVVSALHTVSADLLSDITKPVNSDTFIFGDDMDAKKKVAHLLKLVEGLRPVDGGPLKNSRYGELFTRFLVGVNKRYRVSCAGLRVTWLDDEVVAKRWEQ
ncbi:MAG: NADPH-dependent F420 reductase [Candidatus Caldarchaeum sp.]